MISHSCSPACSTAEASTQLARLATRSLCRNQGVPSQGTAQVLYQLGTPTLGLELGSQVSMGQQPPRMMCWASGPPS